MATRAERLAEFEKDRDPDPDALVEVLCEDHVGTYRVPYLCRHTSEGFANARTGELLEATVVGWREPKAGIVRRARILLRGCR